MPECVHGPEVHYKIVLLMFLLNCEMLHTIIDRAYDYKTALQLECIPDNVALFFSSFAKAKGFGKEPLHGHGLMCPIHGRRMVIPVVSMC